MKMGVRMLDLVQEYTGHSYDQVLGLYYAKARMYDAQDRRFMAADWAGSNIAYTQTFAQYTYVINNPLKYVDLMGLYPALVADIYISIGGNTIINVYVDSVTSVIYVDFFEVARTWGVSMLDSQTVAGAKIIYSPEFDRYARIQLFNDGSAGRQITSLLFNNDGSLIPNTHTFASAYGNLMPFNYFRRIMCSIRRVEELSITSNASVFPVQGRSSANYSSAYGNRRHPNSGNVEFHNGLDIGNSPNGTPLLAMYAGIVVNVEWISGYGNTVKIESTASNGQKIRYMYAHMNAPASIWVIEGDLVTAGQQVGAVGSTGGKYVNHLHVEVEVYDGSWKRVNPNPNYRTRINYDEKNNPISNTNYWERGMPYYSYIPD